MGDAADDAMGEMGEALAQCVERGLLTDDDALRYMGGGDMRDDELSAKVERALSSLDPEEVDSEAHRVLVVLLNASSPARHKYKDLEVRKASDGERWLGYKGGPESMPFDDLDDAIERGGWYAVAGGMGRDEEFVPADELVRVKRVVELLDLRDTLTSALEEIGMFDGGQSGDVAATVLKKVGAWATTSRCDGQPYRFFPHRPHRGSDVEAFLKTHRDHSGDPGGQAYYALDRTLDDYRLHADTGTPLTDPTPEDGGHPSLAQGGDGREEAVDVDFLKRVATVTNSGGVIHTERITEINRGLLAPHPEQPGVVLTHKGWALVREHGWDGDAPA